MNCLSCQRGRGFTHVVLSLALMAFVFHSLTADAAFLGPNLALNKPVASSGPTWTGLSSATLTDGNPATFTHPLAESGTANYYFQVDLGGSYLFEGIQIRNRNDGCCPERLSQYGVEIYGDDGGSIGTLNWNARIRTNRSNSGVGGIDVIRSTNAIGGHFGGRFVRIVNRSGAAYNPQLAEIEVYGAPSPFIDLFAATEDVIDAGASTEISWQIRGATSAFLQGVGSVNATSGAVTLQPVTSTTYTLTASNNAGSVSASLTIGVGVRLGPPVISEFLSDNQGGLNDEEGRSPDWVEIANTNAYSLNLEGYGLTDDPSSSPSWFFPRIKIRPHGFLIVFASGDDRRDPTRPLHAPFRLSAEGDALALYAPGGLTPIQTIPSSYPSPRRFPKQQANVSYGIGTNGLTGYFRPPTPGAANGSAFEGVVEPVVASPGRGFFTNRVTVSLSCPTPGVVIRYSVGRVPPGPTNGIVYSVPLQFSNTTVLRVAAFRDRWASAPVTTHTFIFPSNVAAAANMDTSITRNAISGPLVVRGLLELPSISIVAQQDVNDTTEVGSSFEWIPVNGDPSTQAPCGARWFGGAFTFFEKKNFRLYFRSDYGASKLRYPLFRGHEQGLEAAEEFDAIELRNGSHDMSQRGFYMSNIFADDTLLDMGRLAPHGRFVHMYLNGVYWGVFHLRERWGASMHSSYLGGRPEDFESINGNWNVGGWADPGTPYDGDGTVWTRAKSLRSQYDQLRDWVDIPDYIDYMLLWMYGGSEDEYRCVGPVFPGSGLKFYLNDADGWFCGSYYCAADDRTGRDAPGRRAGDGPGSLFSMLFKEGKPAYRTMLADQIQKAVLSGGPLSSARTIERLDMRCREIQRPFYAEAARWRYLSPGEWLSRWNEARQYWLLRRPGEVITQWRAAGFLPLAEAPGMSSVPSASVGKAQLAFNGPTNASIFYTLDGSDPRLPTGAVSSTSTSNRLQGVTQLILSRGSTWRWLSPTGGLGRSDVIVGRTNWSAANWKHPDYDDASWNQGAGEFGFGEGDEVTVIPSHSGTNRLITSYYRRKLELGSPGRWIQIQIRMKRDDGVIVYVNGAQAVRNSITSGAVDGNTLGTLASDDGQTWQTFPVSPLLFRSGANTIAVELHQTALLDDASFDMEIAGIEAQPLAGNLPEVNVNTLVYARSLSSTGQWSALSTHVIQVSPEVLPAGSMVFSRIHYHPGGTNEAEYVELANISVEAVNLRGAVLGGGIRSVFASNRDQWLPPGGRVLLVEDVLGFQKEFGNRIPVDGRFSGSLDNQSEQLTLHNASGVLVAAAAYADIPPWPREADGAGRALVLSKLFQGFSSNAAAWRVTGSTNGSPAVEERRAYMGSLDLDFDGDGFLAWIEHGMGTSDGSAAEGPGAVSVNLAPWGGIEILFPRSLWADDVQFAVDFSKDLSTWTPATRMGSEASSRPDVVMERWGAEAFGDRGFLRLRAEKGEAWWMPLSGPMKP
ncbi:MAG: hypothetical protein FJ405_07290 [Verrucomicrobia bacterium]|nr:hypothetical protein [Verrucomicrobiota bacterium]